jgi:hypothetical protein
MSSAKRVAHGIGVAQIAEQDVRDQLALLTLPRDGRHNLVEVQIPREGVFLVPGRPGR